MTVILVPGFWLDASSWDEVVPGLQAAGHTVVALTLPGLESVEADRSGIGLSDHVAAVVAAVDAAEDPVVLVGHSGAGTVVHAAVDARPTRVARAIYVDSGPLPPGLPTNPDLPSDGPDLPLPPWEAFAGDDSSDLDGLDAEALAAFRARAVPHPAAAAQDLQRLGDKRRYDVPVTVVTTTFPREVMESLMAENHPYFAELPRIKDVTIVELETGHWPQFSRPADLAAILVDALA